MCCALFLRADPRISGTRPSLVVSASVLDLHSLNITILTRLIPPLIAGGQSLSGFPV